MINHSSNQLSGPQQKKLAVSKTFVPKGYENSTEGFNAWVQHVKNQVHIQYEPTSKLITYQNLFKNVSKR